MCKHHKQMYKWADKHVNKQTKGIAMFFHFLQGKQEEAKNISNVDINMSEAETEQQQAGLLQCPGIQQPLCVLHVP